MLKKKTEKPTKSSKLPIVRRADTYKSAPAEEPKATSDTPRVAPAKSNTKTPAPPPGNAAKAKPEPKSEAKPVPTPQSPTPAETRAVAKVTETAPAAPVAAEPSVLPAPAPADAKPASGASTPAKSDGGMSCLDAAVVVLKAAGAPLRCKEMIDAMAAKKIWTSDAPTPHQTLASALMREISKKGAASRFRKADRGQFALRT